MQRDHILFFKYSHWRKLNAFLVYVDDIIVTRYDLSERKQLKDKLPIEFKIKDLGQLKYFLGINVAHSKKWIFIS